MWWNERRVNLTGARSFFGKKVRMAELNQRSLMRLRSVILAAVALPIVLAAAPQPVPRVQAVPQPHAQISFQRDGVEIARYHYGPDNPRPFVFPLIGPSGRSVTRMGHPRDPESHSHHNSVWFGHQSVGGVNFWEDRGGGRIVHQRLDRIEDGDATALVEVQNAWLDKAGRELLHERRRIAVQALEAGEWLLLLDLQLEARSGEVTFEAGKLGLIGIRLAKTIGVHDGGGTIRNSEGGADEAGCFRKPARWVDYSGPITPAATEGVALFDHPSNPGHPAPFHVRDDGWMGALLALNAPLTVMPGGPLRLRYAAYVHAGTPSGEAIERHWRKFADRPWLEFGGKP